MCRAKCHVKGTILPVEAGHRHFCSGKEPTQNLAPFPSTLGGADPHPEAFQSYFANDPTKVRILLTTVLVSVLAR